MTGVENSDIQPVEDELDLASEDSLPWLESDEDDEPGAVIDASQIVGFIAILAALLLGVVGIVWYFSNSDGDGARIADGSTIAAPEGPYKTRPDDPGGKSFPGTGNVAPVVGEGQTPEARMADAGVGSADNADLDVAMPAIAGGAASAAGQSRSAGSSASSASGFGSGESASSAASSTTSAGSAKKSSGTSTSQASAGGVKVQLAAYSSRARAEKGWRDLTRRTDALDGVRYQVTEGRIDIGTVYRLQALPGSMAAGNALCAALKADGLDCQVKR